MMRGRSPSCLSPSPCGGFPGCSRGAPLRGAFLSARAERNRKTRLGGGRRFDFGSEGRSLAHRRPPPKNPLFRSRAVDLAWRENDRLVGNWTGFSPIGAAACVRLLSHAVPSVDACVVRLKFRGGVGKPPISRGTAHIAMPSPHRGGRLVPSFRRVMWHRRRLTDEGTPRRHHPAPRRIQYGSHPPSVPTHSAAAETGAPASVSAPRRKENHPTPDLTLP